MMLAALVLFPTLALPPVTLPYRTMEQHALAAQRQQRIEFHDEAKAHKAGKAHGRWHRTGWYGQLADVATTGYALCIADGFEEANAYLSLFGGCSNTWLVAAKAGLLIWFMEWNENRERRKHGCMDSPCPPELFKHLNVAWGAFSMVGLVPAGMNLHTILTDEGE